MINQILKIYFLLVNIFNNIIHAVFRQQKPAVIKNISKTNAELTTNYTGFYIVKFSRSFENLSNQDFNKNIDPAFFDTVSFKEAIKKENNDIEKLWRTRLLFENTPRGNVIMHYDAYKIGFAYYSDNYIPYEILNAVAMKYVMTFQCRDFFVDELARPNNSPSKILTLIEEPKKEEKKNTEIENSTRPSTKNGPFAKLKNYNMVSTKVETNNNEKNENSEPKKEKHRNRFVNLGKIVNFDFIQKPKKENKQFKSELAKGLFDNSSVQKEVFSYRDFKALQQKITSSDPVATL